jgi:hypothetical protein
MFMPSGIISFIIMPSLVISQDIRHIIIGMGIMPFIIGFIIIGFIMPPIIPMGIGIMPPIIGIMPLIMGISAILPVVAVLVIVLSRRSALGKTNPAAHINATDQAVCRSWGGPLMGRLS